MTPSQQLIDAAAKVYYERVNAFSEEHGLPYTKWGDLSQEYKEDLLYPVVIGPVTVALRAAVEVARVNAEKDYPLGEGFRNLDAEEIAENISSLIPAQEKTNDR